MESWKQGMIIHGRTFNPKELLAYSSDNIVSANTNPWEKEVFRFIINWLSDSDFIVQFSSGTTGKPKEIRLPKLSMIKSARITCKYLKIYQGDTALLCMPVEYVAGKMMIVRSLACGLNLLMTEPKSVPDIHISPRIDFCAMVPLQVSNLLMCNNDLSPIKNLLIGGAEINHDLEMQLRKVSTAVYATYGMAETSSHIAMKKLNLPDQQQSFMTLPGVRISKDSRGCLVINASYLPATVVSNDLVELTGSGSFNWLGRYDNLINSGGAKIVPEEVETLVMEKTMLECVALGLPDKKLGQKLVFAFEKDEVPDSFSTLKSDLENYLPRRWKPKELITVDKFPRNDALKIDRLKLTEMCLKIIQ
jgi:O-succinylbenzoic acid--CoA ligase